jgi:hypothetical protein
MAVLEEDPLVDLEEDPSAVAGTFVALVVDPENVLMVDPWVVAAEKSVAPVMVPLVALVEEPSVVVAIFVALMTDPWAVAAEKLVD